MGNSKKLAMGIVFLFLLAVSIAAQNIVQVTPPNPQLPVQLPLEALEALIGQSNQWLLFYANASPEVQKASLNLATNTADERRVLMKQLIQRDPQSALNLALSPDQRRNLPLFIMERLEAYVDGVGDYEVEYLCNLHRDDPQVPTEVKTFDSPDIRRRVFVGGKVFIANIYGRREVEGSKNRLPVHGITIDDHMAFREDPLRVLDPGEILDRQIKIGPGMIVAISGDTPYILSGIAALPKLVDQLTSLELDLGPYLQQPVPVGDSPWTHGTKRILIIRVDFSDMIGPPLNYDGTVVQEPFISTTMAEVNSFFEQNSYGQTHITYTLLPEILRMPHSASEYAAPYTVVLPPLVLLLPNMIAPIRFDGSAAAIRYDMDHGGTGMYDPTRYDRFMVVFSVPPGFAPRYYANGAAVRGGSAVGIMGIFIFQGLTHELGHTFFLSHAGREDTIDDWRVDGGDQLDRMGTGPDARNHYNGMFKQTAGWLDGCYARDLSCAPSLKDGWVDVDTNSTFRLFAHDVATIGHRALRMGTPRAPFDYWADMRGLFPEDRDVSNGIELRRQIKSPGGFIYDGVHLMNAHPTVTDWSNHTLKVGESFTDKPNQVRITVLSVGSTADGPYADVRVEREFTH